MSEKWELRMEIREDGSVMEEMVGKLSREDQGTLCESLESFELEGFTDVTNDSDLA